MGVRFKTYTLSTEDKDRLLSLSDSFPNVNSHVLKALYVRGINTKEKIYQFFSDDLASLKTGKYLDGCMEFIAELIKSEDETIVLFGDYDCDGIFGTTVAYLVLSRLGYRVYFHVNDRDVGYGLKKQSIDKIRESYPNVSTIITIDNGISSFEAIDYANELGIKVLVTDHHLSQETLPNAKVIVNPNKVGCPSKIKNNCGAVVIWKVLFELVDYLGRNDLEPFMYDLLDLCAIATIADQVTLVGDNRLIVKHGLKLLNRRSRFSLSLFLDAYNLNDVDTDSIGFYVAPMFNSFNRMGHDVTTLIRALTFDYDDRDYIIDTVNLGLNLNNLRRENSNGYFELIKNDIDASIEDCLMNHEPNPVDNVIVKLYKDMPEGCLGIIASKISEYYSRPAVILTCTKDGLIKGSARSMHPLNIKELFDKFPNVFSSYGGHDYAAGCSFSSYEDFVEFQHLVYENTKDIDPKVFDEVKYIDVVLAGKLDDFGLCDMFDCLKPFGRGFTKPRFYYNGFRVNVDKTLNNKRKSPYVGEDGNTLRLVNDNGLVAIGFNCSSKYRELGEPNGLCLVGKPSINEFNGRKSIQFQIEQNYIMKMKT